LGEYQDVIHNRSNNYGILDLRWSTQCSSKYSIHMVKWIHYFLADVKCDSFIKCPKKSSTKAGDSSTFLRQGRDSMPFMTMEIYCLYSSASLNSTILSGTTALRSNFVEMIWFELKSSFFLVIMLLNSRTTLVCFFQREGGRQMTR
jgi:hypothetical protein